MLNFLWLFMILAGIVYAAFTGNLQAVTDAALDSAQQAVAICITMAGVLAFWVGLMQIAENAGMMRRAAERIYPLLHFLFPRVPKDHPACKSIAANCIANFFGLGWAATPAGLQAMEDLDELEKELSAEFDIEKRAELAVQMQQTVLDDNAYVFCSHLKMSMIMQSNVTGLVSHPCDYYELTADLDIN